MMQSAVPRGESIGTLLVLQRIAIFFMDDGKDKSMTRHRTVRPHPMSKFNAFTRAKYSFHTFRYPLRPALMESPSRRVLDLESLIIKQWLR